MTLHPILLSSLESLRKRFEANERCVGMYMWGSIANGTADDWSDIDVAAVMRDGDYEAVKAEMPAICGADCGRIVAWLPEGEASEFVNDAFLFQVEDRLHLYDFTIMSAGFLERTGWVRPLQVLFDKTGALARAAQRATTGGVRRPRALTAAWKQPESAVAPARPQPADYPGRPTAAASGRRRSPSA